MIYAILAIFFAATEAERKEVRGLACAIPAIKTESEVVLDTGVTHIYADGSTAWTSAKALIVIKNKKGVELFRHQY